MLKLTHKIVHLTSVHPRFDTRIFYKMCVSLANNGYDISLVVADGEGDEIRNGIFIYDVGVSKNRFDRIRNAPKWVLTKAVALNADLYHLHDPELIPIGLKLKKLGKKVIFDSHEDVPKQLLGKPYLNRLMLRVISFSYSQFERFACSRLDAVIAATPYIRDKFLKINPQTVDVNNFPILGELASSPDIGEERFTVCYVGSIGSIRGIREMVQAMEYVRSDIRLDLAGSFAVPELGNEVRQYKGWQRVNELGHIDRIGVREVMSRSLMGLVTLHPVINYIDALPVKMFEYMSSGIPVIASNFPLWREIVEGNDCGLCVDPLSPRDIAMAIDTLAENPKRVREMGLNGQRAVHAYYNWTVEEKKLLQLYEKLINNRSVVF